MAFARLACTAALLCAMPVHGQSPTTPPPIPVPAPPQAAALVHVTLVTDQGPIGLALERDRAPITTANFLRYVDQKRFVGKTIYRAVKVQPGYGLIQGGTQNDPKAIFPAIKHEPTTTTGLTHADGTISMARAAPGSATGDFFITIGAIPSMDADPKLSGDNLGFAAFGHVTDGMDLVRRILDEPTAAGGPAAMKGEMLATPIRILSARRDD